MKNQQRYLLPIPVRKLRKPEDEEAARPRANKAVKWALSRSLWVLVFGTGCCALEIMEAFTTRFDLERFGAMMAESPRKADVLVITGLINARVAEVIRRIYEQMPEPKYVIAVGACSMGGGPYHDSYSSVKRADEIVPVDIYVPGCPVRAEAVVEAIRLLQRKIYGREVK